MSSAEPECQLSAARWPLDQASFPLVLGVFLPIFLAIAISVHVMCTRRRTRLELEGGKCNLPTVVWRPRFMNYTDQDDGIDDDDLIWDSDDCMREWAMIFLEEHRTAQPSDGEGNGMPKHTGKKMGSSAITNILPRMERLKGPYGMYATVYGIQTKVVHVAHPVPARAILTGAGVVEVGGIENALGRRHGDRALSFSWRGLWRMFSRVVMYRVDVAPSSKESAQKRRRSSSMRMLTGSTKYPAYDHFKNFSGDGVFTANGSDWKAKRASVMHCLLRNGDTEKSLESEANRAADSFEREVAFATKSGPAQQKERPVMNVVPMLQRSTIALIYRLISHHDVEFSPDIGREKEEDGFDQSDLTEPSSTDTSVASPGELIDDAQTLDGDTHKGDAPEGCLSRSKCVEQEAQIKSLLPTYLRSVTKIRMIVLAQSRSIWYLLPRWAYRTFSPMYREEERTMGPIREFARMTCESAMPGSPLALLSQRSSHSAECREISTDTADHSKSQSVSKDLLDEAITLLFAGQDTSAATLSWTLHLLSLHPDKQEKVANEVCTVLGKSESRSVSKSSISQMPYLDAVIKESMRLYPVAPFIVRKLTSDITIPTDEEQTDKRGKMNKTTSMPASTFACIWIYALHRNPKLWEQPDEFLPERWIDPELQSRDLGQKEYGSYMPFAIGPRNCLGQPLAQVILRILLARIMKKYVVLDPRLEALRKIGKLGGNELDPKLLRKEMQAGFTVLPSNGLRLQLVERRIKA